MFQATGDLDKFTGINIGTFKLQKDQDYTVKSAKDKDGKSMIEITLKESFLKQLNASQTYQLVVNYNDGIAVADIRNRKITSNWIPKTGDLQHAAMWMTMMVISASGMGLFLLEKKKKQYQK